MKLLQLDHGLDFVQVTELLDMEELSARLKQQLFQLELNLELWMLIRPLLMNASIQMSLNVNTHKFKLPCQRLPQ